ncbi:hypothetical protein SR41_11015 [Sphingomonas melonis]|uniref:Recombinase family protein n=1 Tax=Sphingomonas melonis TaxID=152682 RepID=A0A0D1MHY4_9SPHN|nr:recombinase family protein [Sphingomonas melonis]KIU27216.1 hypothetical protein SR41_11015 [Sphingomonas melonis]
MQAIKYMRWSSEKQSKGSSFARQTRRIDEMAAAQGWPIVDTVVDEGVSAYSGANMFEGGLAKLRERFVREGGSNHVLIVEQLDRLSRLDTVTVIEFFITMTRTGLTIALADSRMIIDATSLRNQTAQLEEIVRESHRANREGQVRADRSSGAWQTMREEGRKVHTSSTCPAWLELINDRYDFRIREDRADVVRDIFRWYSDGMSKRNIARKLNECKIPPFRGAKLGWQPTAVVALINNRAVIGEYQHQNRKTGDKIGDPDPAYFPPIITNEEWQRAHDPRQKKIMVGRGREIHHRNVLQDLAYCQKCGWRMRMNRKTARAKASYVTTYLQCSNYDLRKGCDHRKMHRLDYIEAALLDHILTHALDDQVWSDETAVPALNAKLANERRELDDLSTRLANILSELERRPSERVQARRDALEAEEDALLARITETEAALVMARGAVTPQEHIRRVAEIRADMGRDDDEGLKARKTIKLALNDIIDRIDIGEDGRAHVRVKSGLRSITIHPGGEVWDYDFIHRGRDLPVLDCAMGDYVRRVTA